MTERDNPNSADGVVRCEIHVNEQTVTVDGLSHTAGTIKQAAIAQGVEIEQEFVLSIVTEDGGPKILAEEETIEVVEDCRFVAVDGDDNS